MIVIKMTEQELDQRLILKDQVINYLLVENQKLIDENRELKKRLNEQS